jgi:hypothetical protein
MMSDDDVKCSWKYVYIRRACRAYIALSVASWMIGREVNDLVALTNKESWWILRQLDKYAVAEAKGMFDEPPSPAFVTGQHIRFLAESYNAKNMDPHTYLQARDRFLRHGHTEDVAQRLGFYFAAQVHEMVKFKEKQ